MLRGWLKGKPFDDRLWPGKWAEHFEILLKRDLQRACVPYVDASGRYADFHSLRHRFISGLARAGAHPKVAQDLAYHKTLDMTMKVYTHTHTGDLVDALENPPAPISTTTDSESQEVIATGTNGSEEFAPMFARADDFSGLSVTTDGDTLTGADASAEEHNPPENHILGDDSQDMSTDVAKYAREDSNPQPSDPKSDALSN